MPKIINQIINNFNTQSPQIMFGPSYSQFLQPDYQADNNYYHNQFTMAQPNIIPPNSFKPFSIEQCDNEMEMLLTKNFNLKNYPTDFSTVNPFCPICGKFVHNKQKPLLYDSKKFNKNFLAHSSCLQKQQANSMLNAVYEESQEAKIIPFGLKPQNLRSIPLGGQQYYVEMKIIHTLSDLVLLRQSTRLSSQSTCLKWQIHQEQQTQPYIPTVICFPYTDFKVSIQLTSLKTGTKTVQKMYINLGRIKYNQLKVVTATSQLIKVELRMFYSLQQKEKLINSMNFKYRHDIKLPLPIVEVAALEVMVPEDQGYEDDDMLQDSGINRVINDQDDGRKSSTSAVEYFPKSSFSMTMSANLHHSDNLSERSYEKEKPNFELLLTNQQALSQFVRNNSQSRQFQTFLNEANTKQVDQVIQLLYLELPQLITHEYANYMVQKLFSVCSYTQRLKVMQRLHQDITNVVRNKQGTHTIQALVKFFTNDQEYKLMCESIRQNFFQLSCHPNATHFIQKIIGLFPIIHTYPFFQYTQKNFIDFALDKNAMCVIKHMMKLIAELQKTNQTQKVKQLTSEAKKKFINQVTFCIDKIIQDAFGNYIIQFCYELFGQDKCTGITEMITQRFTQFAIQKYSSSVVHKCISSYWTKDRTFDRLKQSLSGQGILQLFRNKDGNKILLQIMERHENHSIRDKIYNQLLMGEPTKFNHDRWGVVMGIRSGTVGTEYGSFSDAVNKGRKGKGWH